MLVRRSVHLVLAALAVVPSPASPVACSSAPEEASQSADQGIGSEIRKVHFKTRTKGTYLGALGNGGGGMLAAAREAREWETFSLVLKAGASLASGAEVFIKAGNGQYVQAENGGGGGVNAASPNELDWETFRIVRLDGAGAVKSGDLVALRTVSGTYLSALEGGGQGIDAHGESPREWEQFTIEIGDVERPPQPSSGSCGRFTEPRFGPNVCVFDASASMAEIQTTLDAIAARQEGNHFGSERFAYVFKPGAYQLDVKVGFYTQVLGAGAMPDDVSITGAVRARADWWYPRKRDEGNPFNATQNFWRGVENLAIRPTLEQRTVTDPRNGGQMETGIDSSDARWHVSQATHLRRVHVMGNLALSFAGGYSSGGFIADSKVDGVVKMKNQQQWLTRSSDVRFEFSGGANNWNSVFVGVTNPPAQGWLDGFQTATEPRPVTAVADTPRIREKPYLHVDAATGGYKVKVPGMLTNTRGTTWANGPGAGVDIDLADFTIVKPGDSARAMNEALAGAKPYVLFTPGIYALDEPLRVKSAGSVLMGLGLATLTTESGMPTIKLDDVDGVTVAGLILDATKRSTPTMLEIGPPGSNASHAGAPTALFDVHCRVGGPLDRMDATTESCVTLNSRNVILDHTWLWRADHADTPDLGFIDDWSKVRASNGITVNGDDVTAYGLFVEHFQGYQTLWNGNGGEVYFYQSEFPYEARDPGDWVQPDGTPGYPTYKVADRVTTHKAISMGVYAIPLHANKPVKNAFEAPDAPGVSLRNMITAMFWHPDGVYGSDVQHVLNGHGAPVDRLGGGSFFRGR